LRKIEKEIAEFGEEAKRIIKGSESLSNNFDNVTGIVGVGERLAFTILAEMPDVSQFENGEHAGVPKYCGQ
jgi:hypothetical protein